MSSDYDVRLATLKKMGGDASKNYASVYDIDLEILKLTGGGSGGGISEAVCREIVEGYKYETVANVKKVDDKAEENAGEIEILQGRVESIEDTQLKVVYLTQAQYDNLETKDSITLYIITDAD